MAAGLSLGGRDSNPRSGPGRAPGALAPADCRHRRTVPSGRSGAHAQHTPDRVFPSMSAAALPRGFPGQASPSTATTRPSARFHVVDRLRAVPQRPRNVWNAPGGHRPRVCGDRLGHRRMPVHIEEDHRRVGEESHKSNDHEHARPRDSNPDLPYKPPV